MNKVIWYMIDWRDQFDIVKEKIPTYQYIAGDSNGVLIKEIRDHSISGEFISRYIDTLTVEDSSGKVSEIENIRYEKIEFRLNNTQLGLVLYDPPRSIKPFINFISKLSGYRISIKKLHIDIVQWAQHVESEFDQITYTKTTIDDIFISKNCIGKITLKGNKDLLVEVEKYSSGTVLDLEFDFVHDIFGKGKCFLKNTGYCKIEKMSYEYSHISEILERGLIKTIDAV